MKTNSELVVISIAETSPDLEGPVCEVVSERGGDDEEARWGWKEWARDFFERTRAKRAAEPVGGLKLVTAAKPKAVSEPTPPAKLFKLKPMGKPAPLTNRELKALMAKADGADRGEPKPAPLFSLCHHLELQRQLSRHNLRKLRS